MEEVSGVLRLSYYNGDKCPGGRSHVVNVFFQCDKGSGAVSWEWSHVRHVHVTCQALGLKGYYMYRCTVHVHCKCSTCTC